MRRQERSKCSPKCRSGQQRHGRKHNIAAEGAGLSINQGVAAGLAEQVCGPKGGAEQLGSSVGGTPECKEGVHARCQHTFDLANSRYVSRRAFTQRWTLQSDDLHKCAIASHIHTTSPILVTQGIKGSLQGLEESQMQSMRRLAQNVVGAVEDAEASLQVRVPGHPPLSGTS